MSRIKDILDSWTPDVAREFVNSLPDDVSIDMKSNDEDLLSRYIDSKGDIAGVGVVYDWNTVQYGIIPDACLVPMPEWYDVRGFFSLVVGDDLSRGSRLFYMGKDRSFYMGKGRLLRMIDWMEERRTNNDEINPD